MSRPYSEAMEMRPAVTYTPYTTSLREQTDDLITFAQFEEGNILTKTRNDAEIGDESDNESIMMSNKIWMPSILVTSNIMISYIRRG